MAEDPFGDVSKFDGDKTPVESGEKFTVSEWKIVTRDWDPVNRMLVQYASALDPKERETAASEYTLRALFGIEKGDEHFSFVADLMSLSDSALKKLTQALSENEIEEAASSNLSGYKERTKEDWADLIKRSATGTIEAAHEPLLGSLDQRVAVGVSVLADHIVGGIKAGLSADEIYRAVDKGLYKDEGEEGEE